MMDIQKELRRNANPEKAKVYQRFFKTGKGEYGEGDVFLGLTVPETRAIAKKYAHINFREILGLLKSELHEERLAALEILVFNYEKGDEAKKDIFDFYISNTQYINNWDLVDMSAEYIVGDYIYNKNKDILYRLAKSESLWERRIAIVSTFRFIKNGKFDETLKIAELLLNDRHDLMHKAAGWMLREVGKRDHKAEEEFLRKHYKRMPRTMLRYAIERFPERLRRAYLNGEI